MEKSIFFLFLIGFTCHQGLKYTKKQLETDQDSDLPLRFKTFMGDGKSICKDFRFIVFQEF